MAVKAGDALVVLDPIDFDCEFCGGAVTVGSVDDRDVLLHSAPACARFDELEPIEFLRATNALLRGRGRD